MAKSPKTILVIRSLPNMVNAISYQQLSTIVLGLEDGIANQDPNILSTRFSKNITFCAMNFSEKNLLLRTYRYVVILRKLIQDEKPEIVHVNALQDLFLTYIAVLLFSSLKSRPAIVAMSHNPTKWKEARRAWLAAKLIECLTDGFICLSTTHKNQLISLGVPSHKLAVIPNPYEVEQFEAIRAQDTCLDGNKQKGPQIIYIANICSRKAQDVLLRAATRVIEKHPDTTFYFVGKVIDGEEEYMTQLCSLQNELQIGEKIHFTGALAYKKALDMVKRSDIFAFPSYSEMMPRAVVEAMLLGKPIVATAVDGILDLITHRKTGILIQPGNSEDLAIAICELIEKPSFAKLLGNNAQKEVSTRCSPERVGKSFLEFYQRVIDRKLSNGI